MGPFVRDCRFHCYASGRVFELVVGHLEFNKQTLVNNLKDKSEVGIEAVNNRYSPLATDDHFCLR